MLIYRQIYINKLDSTEEITSPRVRVLPLPLSYWPADVGPECKEWGTGWTLFALVGDCWVPVEVVGFK